MILSDFHIIFMILVKVPRDLFQINVACKLIGNLPHPCSIFEDPES